MKPIRNRTDRAILQALRCVQYRIPPMEQFRRHTFHLALSLRYALTGAAGIIYSVDAATFEDGCDVRPHLEDWRYRVGGHYSIEVSPKLGPLQHVDGPALVGSLSIMPLKVALSLKRQGFPLSHCLEQASEIFFREHRVSIQAEYWWLFTRNVCRNFLECSEQSVHYGLNFYDRRHHDLDEVKEIALIGE